MLKIEVYDAFCGTIQIVYQYTHNLRTFTPRVLKEISNKRLFKSRFS